jgi:predicted SAM-dependent methyltransferase
MRDFPGVITSQAAKWLGPWSDNRWRRTAVARSLNSIDRLHLGCGPNVMPGWGNLDLAGGAGSYRYNLTQPLPKADSSVRYIYSEHFIEHIERDDGARLMRECRRVLTGDGVLRVSTPDLRFLVSEYECGRLDEWADMHWHPASPCRLLNESMRLWGHVFLYDEAELRGLLNEAGFRSIERVAYRHSRHAALAGLETRPFHQDLIVEARP